MDHKIALVLFNGCVVPVESREELADLREALNDINS